MIRFFKSPQPATLFVIPLIVFLLWIQAFFKHPFIINNAGSQLYSFVAGLLSSLPGFIQVILAMALISFEAIYFNNILNRHEVLYRNSYLPALMYALLMSLAFPILQFHPLILVNLFLLKALDKMFMLFKNDSPISPLFDSCFLISIASLLYFPAAVMFVLFLVALAILRQFNLREWLISIIGFLLPYFFLSVFFFWTDQWRTGWHQLFKGFIPQHFDIGFTVGKSLAILFALLGVLLLFSMRRLLQNFYKNTVRTRNYQQILGLFFIVAVASSFLLDKIPLYHFTMLALPLSVFFSHYFLAANKRVWFSESLLWGIMGLIAWNNF